MERNGIGGIKSLMISSSRQLGGLAHFLVPNLEDKAAETEENKSKVELIRRNGCDCKCKLSVHVEYIESV
ncbi:unnamed protein product [Prunus armeniaca]